MKYERISENCFNCATCPTPCDGLSKEVYLFENDSSFSEHFEKEIIAHINNSNGFNARKSSANEFPDVEVSDKSNGEVKFYIEVKVQRRTFVSIEKILPQSSLIPSETVALNLSDLLRYFELAKKGKLKIYVLWVLLNRPCVLGETDKRFYYSDTENLQKVYEKQKDKRRFRRKSGEGDVVNGEHKGVVVNYHFSLNELKEWKGF
jgi:hypothetical protein